jgi:hypothetical protein
MRDAVAPALRELGFKGTFSSGEGVCGGRLDPPTASHYLPKTRNPNIGIATIDIARHAHSGSKQQT